jgi:O-antigen ligase
MLSSFFRSFRNPVEFALLLALILFIPAFEATKNILLGLYVATWIANRWVGDDAGRRAPWDGWDTLFAAWIGSAYVVAAFAGLQKNEWHAIFDVWKYVCFAWMLKRSGYEEREWRAIYVTVLVSTTLATAWAIFALALPHKYAGIELHSVGHVNHSAAYITITIGAALAWLASYWHQLSVRQRVAAGAALVVLATAIVLAGSRAAAVATALIILLVGAVWSRRSKSVLLAMATVVIVFTASLQTFDKDMHRKNELAKASPYPMLNERYPLWHQALTAWRAYPWFGVGMENFDEIDQESVRRWVEERGETYDASLYGGSTHAHSLFLTTLAERGVFGLAVILAALVAWGASVLRRVPSTRDPPLVWMLWGGASMALVATVSIGLVNTTLHHEHGLLAMLLLGCWLGARAERRAPSPEAVVTIAQSHGPSIGD